MKRSEALRHLKKCGYRLVRHGRKHAIYTNGKERLAISHGAHGAWYLTKLKIKEATRQ